MNATAEFIAGRALSLAYEAIKFPDVSVTAIIWIGRARRWAAQRNLVELKQELDKHLFRIETHYQEIAAAA